MKTTKTPGPDALAAAPPKRMGRPPRADADKENRRIPVYLSESDAAKLQVLANAAGVSASAWFKLQLTRARVPREDVAP